jgi:hypothetical protein
MHEMRETVVKTMTPSAMTKMMAAACLIAMLLAPHFSRAQDDWEQVPSGGEERKGDFGSASPSGGSDASAVANFLTEMRAIKGDTGKPCEVVGTYAHLAATFRDQGLSEQSQQQDIDSNFERSAAEHHVPTRWIRPIETVFHREVAYAYGHRGMSVEQIKSHWVEICESQRTSE